MTTEAHVTMFGPVPAPAPVPIPLAAHHDDAPPADDAEPGRDDFAFIQDLLRRPAAFIDRLRTDDAAQLVRSLVLTVVLAGAAFGAVVGAYRGGVQIAYCAIKIPLVLLAALVISVPAMVAIARATGNTLGGRDVIALTLGASARFALVLGGMAPVVWLANGMLGYHDAVLAVVGIATMAGLAAAALLFRGLRSGGKLGWLAGLGFIAVYAAVGGQASWMFRPYLVRPQTQSVPFMRHVEGDLADAVRMTTRSAAGIYDTRRTAPASAPNESDLQQCEGERCE